MPGKEPVLWVVAGCLFEVSLPPTRSNRWRWTSPAPGVTLLAEELRQFQHHFRFRAEAAGAATGVVLLRFSGGDGGGTEHGIAVRIAPE